MSRVSATQRGSLSDSMYSSSWKREGAGGELARCGEGQSGTPAAVEQVADRSADWRLTAPGD